MRQHRSNLREEWIGHNRRYLFVATAARVADELAHVHFKRICEPLQRSQCWDCLSVLDLRNVGAGHLHPAGELSLTQMTSSANLANLGRYLQTGFLRSCCW